MVSINKFAFASLMVVFCASMHAEAAKQTQQIAPQKVEQTNQTVAANTPKDNPLFFVDVKFEDFVTRVVPQDKQAEFTQFYAHLIKQTEGMTETDMRKVKAVYYDRAIAALQKNRPEWHKTLQIYYGNPLVTLDPKFDNVRTVVSSFLIRYGAFEDYCTKRATQLAQNTPGVWDTVRSYASSVGNTIAGWFGYGKEEPKQVTA